MKKLWFNLTTNWQLALVTCFGLIFVTGMLFFRIGTLTPGFSATEINVSRHNQSFKSVVAEPINAPYYIIRDLKSRFRPSNAITDRKLSAVIAFTVVTLFYALLRFWYSERLAIFGTLLLASSSWFLRTGRFGSPDILQSLIILPVLIGAWFMRTKRQNLIWLLLVIVAGVLLYIPGMIWYLLILLMGRSRSFFMAIKKSSNWFVLLCATVFIGLISPLMAAIVDSPSQLRILLGFPKSLNPLHIINNLWQILLDVFIRSDLSPALSIAHLPLLDIFSGAMAVLGFYVCLKHLTLDRNKLQIGVLGIGIILISFGGSIGFALILPIVYLFVTAGLAYMLDEWFRVFPRNPLAGNIGSIIMSVAVILTMFYHINNYFIAWPNTIYTKTNFSRRQ